MDIQTKFGSNVKKYRQSKNWSQEKLAFEALLDRTYISGIERATRNVSITTAEKIAQALDIPITELLK